MLRREVNSCHENAVIGRFMEHLKTQGQDMKVVCKPDPPDAIVIIDGKKSWVEFTDAFLSPALAESITSYIADDKKHKPVPIEPRKASELTQHFDEVAFDKVVNDSIKTKHKKMKNVAAQYGPGILIIGIENPFSFAEKESLNRRINIDPKVFKSVYFYDSHDTISNHSGFSRSGFYKANIDFEPC